jgi:hypothetical protein
MSHCGQAALQRSVNWMISCPGARPRSNRARLPIVSVDRRDTTAGDISMDFPTRFERRHYDDRIAIVNAARFFCKQIRRHLLRTRAEVGLVGLR